MLVGAELDSDPLGRTWLFPCVWTACSVCISIPFHSFPGTGFVLSARWLPGDFLPPIFQGCSLQPCGWQGRQSGPRPGPPALPGADCPVPRPERPPEAHPRVPPRQERRTPVFLSQIFPLLPFAYWFVRSIREHVLSTHHGLALCMMLRMQPWEEADMVLALPKVPLTQRISVPFRL